MLAAASLSGSAIGRKLTIPVPESGLFFVSVFVSLFPAGHCSLTSASVLATPVTIPASLPFSMTVFRSLTFGSCSILIRHNFSSFLLANNGDHQFVVASIRLVNSDSIFSGPELDFLQPLSHVPQLPKLPGNNV